MVNDFSQFCHAGRLPTSTLAELDTAVVEYLHELYYSGATVDQAAQLLSALAFSIPGVSRRTPELPRARRALKGFNRLAPPRARLPLPWPVTALLVTRLTADGHHEAAFLTVLNFVFYTRPSEILRLRRRDLVPPPPIGPVHLRRWSVLLKPFEKEDPSKTGVFDESLLSDNPEFKWVDAELARLRRSGPLDSLITDLTYPQWVAQFNAAVNSVPVRPLRPVTIYQLRHGGASHELLTGARDLSGVKKRGRWMSDASLQRYVKGGRVAEQLARLDEVTLRVAAKCAAQLSSVIRDPSLASRLLLDLPTASPSKSSPVKGGGLRRGGVLSSSAPSRSFR